jgi:hypothetical protein
MLGKAPLIAKHFGNNGLTATDGRKNRRQDAQHVNRVPVEGRIFLTGRGVLKRGTPAPFFTGGLGDRRPPHWRSPKSQQILYPAGRW